MTKTLDDEAADARIRRSGPRVSVITRVVVALVVLLFVFSATLGYSIRIQRQLVRGLARINDGYVPMIRQLDELGRVVSTVAQVAAETDPVALRQSLRASVRLFPYAERNSTGDIETFEGTQVQITIWTRRPVIGGRLLLELGGDDTALELRPVYTRALATTVVWT